VTGAEPFTPHPWQRDAIEAYFKLGGVVVWLDPGTGKTYVAAKIAARCARPLLVTPAPRQALAQFREYGVPAHLAAGGPGPPGSCAIATYAWLTGKKQANWVAEYAPSDVLLDEFHRARGLGHSARRRVEAYLEANPAVRVAVFTGSPSMSGRLHDFAYGLTWALRSRARGLVPQLRSGLDALEAHFEAAGPSARGAFRARLAATPGVFLDVGGVGSYDGEVHIRLLRPPGGPVAELPDTWELPGGDGVLIESAAHAAEVDRQLAWGYYLETRPRPSQRYREARQRWGRVVRRVVLSGLDGVHTEAQVRDVEPEEYARWLRAQEVEGPVPDPVPVWLPGAATGPLAWATSLAAGTTPTLVWARHRALQEAAAEALDAPLHRSLCRAASGQLPTDHGQTAVLSVDSCSEAYNFQTHYWRNLILEPSADPEEFKQLVGRTARQGQKHPYVDADVVVNGKGAARALHTAIERAMLVQQLTGKSNPLLSPNVAKQLEEFQS
jgi:hypothetical protein